MVSCKMNAKGKNPDAFSQKLQKYKALRIKSLSAFSFTPKGRRIDSNEKKREDNHLEGKTENRTVGKN